MVSKGRFRWQAVQNFPCHFLNTRPLKSIPTERICDLIRMILGMNNFSFNGQHFLQKKVLSSQLLLTYLTTNPCASIGEKVISLTSCSIVPLPPTLSNCKTKHHQEHFHATDPGVALVTTRRRLIR